MENKSLKYEIMENSKIHDLHMETLNREKQRLDDFKKEVSEKDLENVKSKDNLNSKIANYKTRIFFLESQIDEFEEFKKSQSMKIDKLTDAKETAEIKLADIREKLEEIIASESKLKKKDKQNQNTISELNGKIEKLEKQLVEVKTELADKMFSLEMK
jgi:chromosome segregation ATPase